MCGIAGFIDKKKSLSPTEKKHLGRAMLQRIKHRGLDSSGLCVTGDVVIGHNRLAIIDISQKAKQPFLNKTKTLVMSYNGEVFNHTDLRKKISGEGFNSTSDTETVMRAYEEFGNLCFGQFRGMFATSIYNKQKDDITLAVDQFGIKPLYYINTPDWFAWSSEAKVFSLLPNVETSINEDALYEYGIFRTISGTDTISRGISKLLPGEIMVFGIKQNSIRKSHYPTKKEVTKDVSELLHESVSEHLLADVPIGLQLSGGVDSSLISVMVAKQLKPKRLHSFSIGLRDSRWNEFKYSRLVAKLINSIHHEITFTQQDFCELLPVATYHLDEPISYPNTVPIMMLSKNARKYVKVLMSGEGADELFGGYLRYNRLIARGLTLKDLLLSNSFCPPQQVKQTFNTHGESLLYRKSLIRVLKGSTPANKLSVYDIKTFLPSLLLRQDKMGMASNLENRFPFLDPRLVKSAIGLPDSDKVTKTETKILLKRIAERYLPESIVHRKKCGFGLPISDWLRDKSGLGKYLLLLNATTIERPFLNYKHISKLIREHLSRKKDNSEILWILISLEVWLRVFVDGEIPESMFDSLRKQG